MREYRKLKQEEQKKLKEDLKHKSEIIEKIAKQNNRTTAPNY